MNTSNEKHRETCEDCKKESSLLEMDTKQNNFILKEIRQKKESFIGMLEPGEADRMREKLVLFKKRFNDAFARKVKRLSKWIRA